MASRGGHHIRGSALSCRREIAPTHRVLRVDRSEPGPGGSLSSRCARGIRGAVACGPWRRRSRRCGQMLSARPVPGVLARRVEPRWNMRAVVAARPGAEVVTIRGPHLALRTNAVAGAEAVADFLAKFRLT